MDSDTFDALLKACVSRAKRATAIVNTHYPDGHTDTVIAASMAAEIFRQAMMDPQLREMLIKK